MSVNHKNTLSEYIIYHSIFILTIVAACMILFMSIFSNFAIWTSINDKLPKSGKFYGKNIRIANNELMNLEVLGSQDVEGIEHIILDSEGGIVFGQYPLDDLKKIPINDKKVQKVNCSNGVYYIYDYYITVRDSEIPYHSRELVVRSFINDVVMKDLYKGIRMTGYVSIILVLLACFFITVLMTRNIVTPINKLRSMAEKIGDSQDLSERIEIDYEKSFFEIDALIKANNRMLERAETLLCVQRQFSSDVAHEIKTPISVIIAQCQYSSRYLTKDEEVIDAFQLIENQAKKTNDIVTKLFALTRLEHNQIKLQLEYVDFSEIIHSVCESESLLFEKNITLHKDIQRCFINVDINLMMIAIRNIINNALKYSDANSSIWITTEIKNNNLIFNCKDQGCGMDKDELSNIFHRFYRSDFSRNSEGFGLGLSITKNIIELHHGTITANSKKDEGTIFSIQIPLNTNKKE